MAPRSAILLESSKRMQTEYHAMKATIKKAKEAMQLAKDILDYCPGDKWERECTSGNRDKFQKLFDEIFKT